MPDMTQDEIAAYLAEPGHDLIIATVNAEGQPHVVPVWYIMDGGDVVFSTGYGGVKGRNMRANPKVAACVSQPADPIMFVSVQGDAVEVADVGEKRRLVSAIMRKHGDSGTPEGDMTDTFVVRIKARSVVGVRY
jgi:PPOX class probable F420-dependent enzyme